MIFPHVVRAGVLFCKRMKLVVIFIPPSLPSHRPPSSEERLAQATEGFFLLSFALVFHHSRQAGTFLHQRHTLGKREPGQLEHCGREGAPYASPGWQIRGAQRGILSASSLDSARYSCSPLLFGSAHLRETITRLGQDRQLGAQVVKSVM